AGGAIIRNKTFWFGAFEGQRQRQAQFARANAPTAAIWDGDFGSAITQNSEPITIYDPLSTGASGTRTVFPNNQIPKSRISPYAQAMHDISAAPAGPNAGANPWVAPNFETFYARPNDASTVTAKIDHVFSEKDTLSGRFTKSWLDAKTFGGVYGY